MEQETTIIDLRGSDPSSAGAGFGVLADPTGRRGRRLRRVGRAVAVLFAGWLAALALAGLGLLPGVGIPLAARAGAGSAPPPLDDRSPLVAAKRTGPALATPLASATPAAAAPAAPVSVRLALSRRRAVARERPLARGRKRAGTATPVAGTPAATSPTVTSTAPAQRRSATAPGRIRASPGRSGTAPGQTHVTKTPAPPPTPTGTVTPSRGKSGSAPGRSSSH